MSTESALAIANGLLTESAGIVIEATAQKR
jgi:hypothetical protein